jgi:hypothetical protein
VNGSHRDARSRWVLPGAALAFSFQETALSAAHAALFSVFAEAPFRRTISGDRVRLGGRSAGFLLYRG